MDERLCQFYDKLINNNRRFVSAYRPGGREEEESSRKELPWPVPLPGLRDSSDNNRRFGGVSSSSRSKSEGGVWQIGFGPSGEPLRGSAWRSAKQSHCFNMVGHVDHIHGTPAASAPLEHDVMRQIFEIEKNFASVITSSTTTTTTTVKPSSKPKKTRKNNNNSVVKGKKKNSEVNRKFKVVPATTTGAPPHKSNSQQQQAKQRTFVDENQQRLRRTKSTTTTTTEAPPLTLPAELVLRLNKDQIENVLDDVDFDSYLAETEQLLAQAAPKAHHSSGETGTHSAFILLDSGGWQEVVIDAASSAPLLQQQDQHLIINS